MTAIQTTTPSNELTDWKLLQYHNKCVARAANWANGCKTVMHLQVDNESSLIATVLKVACFAILSIGFLFYDVVNEVWRESFGQNQIVVEPSKPTAPETPKKPAKAKAPPPTLKKHTPHKPVDGTVSAKLDALEGGLCDALEIAYQHTDLLVNLTKDRISLKQTTKAIETKVGELRESLEEIQEKIGGISRQVIDELTPQIQKTSKKHVNFGGASVILERTPTKAKDANTQFARTPFPVPSSSAPGSSAKDSPLPPSERDDLNFSDGEDGTPSVYIRVSHKDLETFEAYVDQIGFSLKHIQPQSTTKTEPSTTSTTPRRGDLFGPDASLSPILRPNTSSTQPNTNPVNVSLTPVGRRSNFLSSPPSSNRQSRQPLGVPRIDLLSPLRGASTPAKSTNATTPQIRKGQRTDPRGAKALDESMQFTPNHSKITGKQLADDAR